MAVDDDDRDNLREVETVEVEVEVEVVVDVVVAAGAAHRGAAAVIVDAKRPTIRMTSVAITEAAYEFSVSLWA